MEEKFVNKNILIVEDELEWAETIKGYLNKEGYNNIYFAHNLEDAITELNSKSFCFAIIDLNLKDSLEDKFEDYDGLKLIRIIDKISYQHRPLVIGMSGYVEEIPEKYKSKFIIPRFFRKEVFDKREFINVINSNMPSKV